MGPEAAPGGPDQLLGGARGFEFQADSAPLEGMGADLGPEGDQRRADLKRPRDARRRREKLHEAGYEGFPNALVAAPICRPDLLCETEALAVLPRAEEAEP